MTPNAPAANPTQSNTNMAFGGYGSAAQDYASASNILNNLPSQETNTIAAANNANANTGSILPNINISTPSYTAPTIPTINAGSYGTNLTGYNSAVQNAESGLLSGENSTYGSAMNQLSQAEQQYGNLTPVYQNLAQQYNIPGYQSDVANLSNLLQNLTQDVNSETTLGGGLMTESARDEMYANQEKPLDMALNNASEFLNFGQQDVSNLLDTYEKSLTNELNPLQTDISNLPGLFSETNSAAENGYNQGSTAIENTIENQQRAQEVAAEQEQAAAAEKQANALYGSGGTAELGGTANATTNKASYGLKVANKPSSGYYFENANGQPINAIQYAQAVGLQPIQVVTAMANSGDAGAKQLINEISYNNPGANQSQLNSQIMQYYGNF